jgi:hypothetical protein
MIINTPVTIRAIIGAPMAFAVNGLTASFVEKFVLTLRS